MFVLPTERFKYQFFVNNTNMIEDELIKNVKTILKSADLVYTNKDYTSATILYFKAIFSILDFIILGIKGKTPKDHTERFRILQQDFPELYASLDKYFKIYRDTYSISIDKETCDLIKEYVKRTAKEYKIEV
ncbi:MAG: hypothetical protein QT11_C0001G0185 [archaeon GW2011_AR20]|nr:MAG: hypothetical protein QT11_C0001G0185 [archaeon GW2011_AR20]